MNALAHYETARAALAACHTIDEVRELRDRAEAMAAYARQAKDDALVRWATEIKVRAERRAGQMLCESPKNPGAKGTARRQHEVRSHRGTAPPPKLDELGITKNDSSRWQKLASIEEEVFEKALVERSLAAAYVTTASFLRQVKEAEREQRREANRATVDETDDLSDADLAGKFSTIVIDPPWDWGDKGDVDQLGRAKPTYATMTLPELLELPVGTMADSDCHLYLWITNRSLPKGFALLEEWGFRYVTALTWCKPSFGMGNYFRGSTEHVLFGVKGSLALKRKDVGTWFTAPRGSNGHSSKPAAFYALVESCSHGPYLEMFARSCRAGWTSWGAEIVNAA